MRRSNKARTDRNEKKQRSDFAMLFEIGGQKTEQGDDNRDADDYIFDSFVRQKRDAEKRQKGNYKRHPQAMDGAQPGNRRTCFIPKTGRVECLKI